MSDVNIFEVAVRSKFRFPFRGSICVEDLWDLTVENLDSIFKVLNSEVRQANEDSLLNTKTKEDEELALKIEIIRHIVSVKQQEKTERLDVKRRKEQKAKLTEILYTKQNAELAGKSVEELEAMIAELD